MEDHSIAVSCEKLSGGCLLGIPGVCGTGSAFVRPTSAGSFFFFLIWYRWGVVLGLWDDLIDSGGEEICFMVGLRNLLKLTVKL